MSIDPTTAGDAAAALAAEMRGAARRADARLAVAIDDYALPVDARLDDRIRARLNTLIHAVVSAIEGELRHHAVKLLNGAGDAFPDSDAVMVRLARAGVFRDPPLMDEMLAAARFAALAAALPAGGEPGMPSLLIRLVDAPDRVVAQAARALLVAESREDDEAGLPAPLHERLVWWVAAALGDDGDARDRALVEAALRSIGAHGEIDRPVTLAARLALAVDARPDELGPLLLAALDDRRLTFFAAALAQALKLAFEDVRALLIDDDGGRLWIALRAAALDRATIARIALVLAQADPRRDIEGFADRLDTVAGVAIREARAALASLALHPAYRAARALIGSQ